MNPKIITQIPQKYAYKFAVVGDLMADVGSQELGVSRGIPCGYSGHPQGAPEKESGSQESGVRSQESQGGTNSSGSCILNSECSLIGLLPGSKPAKLAQGVPLTLAIAQHIHETRPETRFVIPVAPTLDFSTLAHYADPQHNPLIQQLGWGEAQLLVPTSDSHEKALLKTPSGLCIELWRTFPAYDLLSQCCLCLTTVGANTAELGSLGIPMIVLLPTQQLDAMRAWDGLPGLLVRLPGVGYSLAKIINFFIIKQIVRQKRLFAWPNIWAKEEIVPELFGKLQPENVAQLVLDYLEHPEKLEEMRSRLRAVRGQPGAAQKLAELVRETL